MSTPRFLNVGVWKDLKTAEGVRFSKTFSDLFILKHQFTRQEGQCIVFKFKKKKSEKKIKNGNLVVEQSLACLKNRYNFVLIFENLNVKFKTQNFF